MRIGGLGVAALAALSLWGLPASSQQPAPAAPVYNVEIIVFRALSALGPPESWAMEAGSDAGPAAPVGDQADTATAATAQGGHFVRALAPSEFQLDDLEAKLRASGGYAPVVHTGWSQTASPWGDHAGIPLQRLGIDAANLSGSVTLERGQYLHLGMLLNYAPPMPPPGLAAAPGTVFTINDNHRVRFYERDYFDHPAFGVIALVTPAQGARPAGR